MWRLTTAALVFIGLCGSPAARGALSANLIQGGDFEGANPIRVDPTPRGMLPQQFDAIYDLGVWLAETGVSNFDDPRDPIVDLLGNDNGYSDMGDGLEPLNISVDPLNASNHILETTAHQTSFGQWIGAPSCPLPNGLMRFNFDFFYDDWDDADPLNHQYVDVHLYGLNFLPADGSSILNRDPGSFFRPLGDDPVNNPVGDGELLARFTWGGSYTDPGNVGGGIDDTGGWVTVDTNTPDVLWDDSTASIVLDPHANHYDYYALAVDTVVYTDEHLYSWFYSNRVTDTFTQGFDDFNLQIALQQRGDFNLDGQTNLLDINAFVTAIVDWMGYVEQYPLVCPCAVDPTPDDGCSIRLPDIPVFVDLIVGGGGEITTCDGACCGDTCGTDLSTAIPEPTSIGLLAMACLALLCRRRTPSECA